MGKGDLIPTYFDFDAQQCESTTYLTTNYQTEYFVMPSFESAKDQMKQYGRELKRPFDVSYVQATREVQVDGHVTIRPH